MAASSRVQRRGVEASERAKKSAGEACSAARCRGRNASFRAAGRGGQGEARCPAEGRRREGLLTASGAVFVLASPSRRTESARRAVHALGTPGSMAAGGRPSTAGERAARESLRARQQTARQSSRQRGTALPPAAAASPLWRLASALEWGRSQRERRATQLPMHSRRTATGCSAGRRARRDDRPHTAQCGCPGARPPQ